MITISNLKKEFGRLTAVDDISFEIQQSEIFGLLGPNGAGKTTAINMICGLLPPTSGQILFTGSNKSVEQARTQIGICPQENVFWPKLTCYEQLAFTGRIYNLPGTMIRKRAGELLGLMGLEDKTDTLAKNLSGGMKRRLSLCLALIHDPAILAFDEPEAGLDPQSRILVRDFIKNLARQKTILLTTHNMDEAERLADRVAIIDHGKLLLLDTPRNLKKSIGEGDVLEIVVEPNHSDRIAVLSGELANRFDRVKFHTSTLFIHSKNLIEAISDITAKIRSHGFEVKKTTLRENTLEDVFIHLTGRKLRQ